MRRTLIALLLILPSVARAADAGAAGAAVADAAAAVAPEAVETDRWYLGTLNGQPAASLHAVVMRRPDGTRRSQDEMVMVIGRSLGAQSIRIEMRQTAEMVEDADGKVASFRFDEDQNGERTTASGRIEGDEIVASVYRLGRTANQHVAIPKGARLLGQRASQEAMTDAALEPGGKLVFATPQLVSGAIVVATSTATFKQALDGGKRAFEVVADIMPIPMQMTVDATGELASMALNLGFFALSFAPSDGPVALKPADLASTGLVTAQGPAPSAGESNRYRLPAEALASLPDDPFQKRDGDLLVVSATPRDEPPADRDALLKAEPQLELDDAELRAWVADVVAKAKAAGATTEAAVAEELRLAVRSRITRKDLGKADGSALEAFREQRGDCTEHANLLCAALRIAGIPARSEVGLVYAGDFGGWVGHAWNTAFADGHWLHLDSAYPGVARSEYLKLGTTSGRDTPGTMAAMVTALAQVLGKSVETVP